MLSEHALALPSGVDEVSSLQQPKTTAWSPLMQEANEDRSSDPPNFVGNRVWDYWTAENRH